MTTSSSSAPSSTAGGGSPEKKPWIRGVNLGGWLVLERPWTPYLFALNDCTLRGDFRYFPGQVSSPPWSLLREAGSEDNYGGYQLFDGKKCTFVDDFPVDEWTLCQQFIDWAETEGAALAQAAEATTAAEDGGNDDDKVDDRDNADADEATAVEGRTEEKADDDDGEEETTDVVETTEGKSFDPAASAREAGRARAREYLRVHWNNFVTKDDLIKLKKAGVTHVRVPLPHWILEGSSHAEEEPYVDGGWPYFVRLVKWARDVGGIKVWPDVHTAPGSQNGFDNSGRWNPSGPTCRGWDDTPSNVERSLRAVKLITAAIAEGNMLDVVTGFGPINEPFLDCRYDVVRRFYDDSLEIIRRNMGEDTAVYVGDMFNAKRWGDGWWTDPRGNVTFGDTFLDSHYYHVFAEETRALSPRQHIAYVCRHNRRDTVGCCYEGIDRTPGASAAAASGTLPSRGVSRIVGEWSGSFDTLVSDMLDVVMEGIRTTGVAYRMDRKIHPKRMEFLRRYVEAQMVTYEAADVGVSRGWFYWTFKTEGGAFAEWDFLRGIDEGWIPRIPSPAVDSVSLYGTCEDIIFETNDDPVHVIDTYPPSQPYDPTNWQGVMIDDDVVVSHGQSLIDGGFVPENWDEGQSGGGAGEGGKGGGGGGGGAHEKGDHAVGMYLFIVLVAGLVAVGMFKRRGRGGYTEISSNGTDDDDETSGKSMEITV